MTVSRFEEGLIETWDVLTILRDLKYAVHTIDKTGPEFTCYLHNRKGLTVRTLEKRLTGSGIICVRYGWDREGGPYMVVREEREA
jgi:hypothetical protein